MGDVAKARGKDRDLRRGELGEDRAVGLLEVEDDGAGVRRVDARHAAEVSGGLQWEELHVHRAFEARFDVGGDDGLTVGEGRVTEGEGDRRAVDPPRGGEAGSDTAVGGDGGEGLDDLAEDGGGVLLVGADGVEALEVVAERPSHGPFTGRLGREPSRAAAREHEGNEEGSALQGRIIECGGPTPLPSARAPILIPDRDDPG